MQKIGNRNGNSLMENQKFAANEQQRKRNQTNISGKAAMKMTMLKLYYSEWGNGTFTTIIMSLSGHCLWPGRFPGRSRLVQTPQGKNISRKL
jgi:hypothetical protein